MNSDARIHSVKTSNLLSGGIRGFETRLELAGIEREIGVTRVMVLRGGPIELDTGQASMHASLIDFIFPRQGVFSYLSSQGWVRVEAELVIASDAPRRHVRLTPRWNLVAVRTPREAMVPFASHLPIGIAVFRQRTVLENGILAFLATLMATPEAPSPIQSYALEQLIMEMTGTVLLDRLGFGTVGGAPRAVVLDRAMTVIAQRSSDPDLTPSSVAREVLVSLRQLQAVFAASGTTVANEIRRRRTKLAYKLLTDPRYDSLSIAEVAAHSGFGTAMSLRRAIDETYGAAPREIRVNRPSPS